MQPITVSTTDATGGTTYSRKVRMDSWANPTSIIQVNVTGIATYTVEGSMDDPNSATNPVAEGSAPSRIHPKPSPAARARRTCMALLG